MIITNLGFPDFYPPKPGQDEDQMTEENVKKGFNDSLFVQNEHFSAHDVIFDELKKTDTLKNLGDFMTDIMKRKIETNTFQGYLGLCCLLIHVSLTLFSDFFFFFLFIS